MIGRKKPSSTSPRSRLTVMRPPDADRYEEDVVVVDPVAPDAGVDEEAGGDVVVVAGAGDSFFSGDFVEVVSPPLLDGGLSLSE